MRANGTHKRSNNSSRQETSATIYFKNRSQVGRHSSHSGARRSKQHSGQRFFRSARFLSKLEPGGPNQQQQLRLSRRSSGSGGGSAQWRGNLGSRAVLARSLGLRTNTKCSSCCMPSYLSTLTTSDPRTQRRDSPERRHDWTLFLRRKKSSLKPSSCGSR